MIKLFYRSNGIKNIIYGNTRICCPNIEKTHISLRSPENLKDKKEIDYLKNLSPDVVIVVAYGQILPLEILEISNIKFLNIHASLLPKWRGAAPIQRSIIEMDKETGISIMKIVPKLDAGPYLIQEKIKIF